MHICEYNSVYNVKCFEWLNRHRSDNRVNNRKVQVLIDRKLQSKKWMDIQVGDIIKLENNQFVTVSKLFISLLRLAFFL
ncbi:ATPase class I type 8B member 4 [Ameca splendens]|uniref:ATPase class I type 8B member 4 n=1 Tax=Ameca splendens TaxID=208324 RepID=A0ABV0Z1G3_9TELE